jgi:uncharacterized protein (TIGR02265 family)
MPPDRIAEEPIFFASAFEALFERTLHGHASPELKEKLRAAGVDVDRRLKVAYPFKVWEDVVAVIAKDLHPGVGDEEAWFRLGLDFWEGFNATLIGKAAIGMAKLVGLDRAFERFTSNMRNINNAGQGMIELREKGRMRLRMRLLEKFRGKIHPAPPQVPHYLRGVLLGVLRGLGKPDADVALVETSPLDRDSLYELTWTER